MKTQELSFSGMLQKALDKQAKKAQKNKESMQEAIRRMNEKNQITEVK